MMDISINFHFGEEEFARAVAIYEEDWCDDINDINERTACGACLAVHLEGYEWESLVPFIRILDEETKKGLATGFMLAAQKRFITNLCTNLGLNKK